MLQVGDEVYHVGAKCMISGKITAVLEFDEGALYRVKDAMGLCWLMPASALKKFESKEADPDE